MKAILIHCWLLIVVFVFLCFRNYSASQSNANNARENLDSLKKYHQAKFVFDSCINGKLVLQNPASIEKNIGNLMAGDNVPRDSIEMYYYCFLSNDNEEYIKMRFCPGGIRNGFYDFEIGYRKNLPRFTIVAFSKLDPFYTSSGVHLGMSKQQVIDIKGKSYIRKLRDTNFLYKKVYETLTYCRLKADYMDTAIQQGLCEVYWFKRDTLRMFDLTYGCEP